MSDLDFQSTTYMLDGTPLSIRLIRSGRRVKTITLGFDQRRGIYLAVPALMRSHEIADFLKSREEWLREFKSDLANSPPPPDWDKGALIPFRGQDVLVVVDHQADLRRNDGVLVQRSIDGCELSVSVPEDVAPERRYGVISDAIEQWYISEAKQHLPQRLAEWSELTGLRPERVRVGNARQRWGSCTGKRTISLTWRLVQQPDRLSDYVIVHELAHLREMNHQRPFWDLVESIMPDARARSKELRKRSHMSVG